MNEHVKILCFTIYFHRSFFFISIPLPFWMAALICGDRFYSYFDVLWMFLERKERNFEMEIYWRYLKLGLGKVYIILGSLIIF